MKYQMVIQWQEKDITYERLIKREEMLDYDLGIGHEVDGHDMGSNQANIFLFTDNPEELLKQIFQILNQPELKNAKIAYREVLRDDFIIVYPKSETTFEIA